MSSLEIASTAKRARRLPQIRLLTLLLLTACAAVWCGVWIARQEVRRLQSQLMQTRELARELVIKDRSLLSVVRQDEKFYDENIWQVFVPRDGMKICVATTGINGQVNQVYQPELSGELKAGRHNLELKVEDAGDQWRVIVEVDMEPLIQLSKNKDWHPNRGSSGGGYFNTQEDFAEGQPAVLYKRVFFADRNGKTGPNPDGNGVVMWIE